MIDLQNVMQYVYIIIVVLISLSFHEFAHAFVSYTLGDTTAKDMGRLTINPMKHLDPLGTIMMVASMIYGAGIGWAKPVPINPTFYKNRKLGTMLTSIAGPVSNLLLAFISAFPLLFVLNKYGSANIDAASFDYKLYTLSLMFLRTNIMLAAFNLLPVPPLDGSKILSGILPSRQYFRFMQYENYIGMAFILLIFVFPGALRAVMGFITVPVGHVLLTAANAIFNIFA